jgi:O-methyltransferase
MKDTAITLVRAALKQTGFRLEREDGYRRRVEGLIRELVGWHDLAEPPGVGEAPLRVELLADLESPSVSLALCLIRHLHGAEGVPGDVCVFGVADGAAAAVLANELRDTDRELWLYDSFEWPARPAANGALLDRTDGSAEHQQRPFGHNVREVRARLDEVGFPPARTHIVAGDLDEEVTRGRLPGQVCLAFVDGGLHEPTRIALDLLHERLPAGAAVVVDGYGYFTTGAKAAVDRFAEVHAADYEVCFPHRFAGQFALLRRCS